MSASHHKSTQVHARPGLTESQVDASCRLNACGPCDGLASHTGGSRNTLLATENGDDRRPDWSLVSYAVITVYTLRWYPCLDVNFTYLLIFFRQNALLATISEKDANIALLELSPTAGSDAEVRKFKAEKDKLVNELKEQVT